MKTFVFITQVYPPDPAALGQHLADVANELARRGHRVHVFAAARGYDDPGVAYKSREIANGVEVRRLPLGSFGKTSIPLRVFAGALLLVQATFRALFVRGVDAVVVSTSPPIAPLAGVVLAKLKGARLKYWVMDVNPDQMIALGKLQESSPLARMFDRMNRLVLKRADDVIVLDELMAELVIGKRDVASKLTVAGPWAAEEPEELIPHSENTFRSTHQLDGKVVVMYSGNFGLSHPMTTILDAARRLGPESPLLLVLVGGGAGKRTIDPAAHILSLPYQSREMLAQSLSAADVHLVTLGDRMAGIVHPSKVYGAMAVGRPILLLGPSDNPIAELVTEHQIGWRVSHGDVDEAERVLREIVATPSTALLKMGKRARQLMDQRGGREASLARVCDILERGVYSGSARTEEPETTPGLA
ncbi:MAG TPA: glycosyltransferase family 4 protein [Gemmatimonadaceae bacterium]